MKKFKIDQHTFTIGIKVKAQNLSELEGVVVESLKANGFGVLTEINIQTAFKEKLNTDVNEYKILGACSPKAAYEALSFDASIGGLLPCNVCLINEGGGVFSVFAIDPIRLFGIMGNDDVKPLAENIGKLLQSVLDSVSEKLALV